MAKRKVKKTNHIANAFMVAIAGAELSSGALSQIFGPKAQAILLLLWPMLQSFLAEFTDRSAPKAE